MSRDAEVEKSQPGVTYPSIPIVTQLLSVSMHTAIDRSFALWTRLPVTWNEVFSDLRFVDRGNLSSSNDRDECMIACDQGAHKVGDVVPA